MTRLYRSGATLNGLDLSGVDDAGVTWTLGNVAGWSGSPASSLTLTQKPAGPGAFASRRPQFAGRVLSLEGTIESDDERAVSEAVDKLNDAAALDLGRLAVSESGRERWVSVQRQDEVLVDDSIATCARYSLQLVAPDPYKYGETIAIPATGLPHVVGGLGVPFGVPFGIASDVDTGQVSALNPGNATGLVYVRIDGPVVGPVITHATSGRVLAFSPGLALRAGEWLDIDMKNETALANGTAPRATLIARRGWSGFAPGANTWAFAAATFSGTAQFAVTVIPAWK